MQGARGRDVPWAVDVAAVAGGGHSGARRRAPCQRLWSGARRGARGGEHGTPSGAVPTGRARSRGRRLGARGHSRPADATHAGGTGGGTDTSGSGCHGGGGRSREPQASARRAGPMPGAPSAQAHSRLSSIAVGAKPLGDPRGGARARHARGRPQSAARQTGTEAYDSHGWRGHFA